MGFAPSVSVKRYIAAPHIRITMMHNLIDNLYIVGDKIIYEE